MSHMNYFEPYESKTCWHEDQLTRAFLIVLRYVPSALFMFYDLVASDLKKKASKRRYKIELPYFSQIDLTQLDFKIQTRKIEEINKMKTKIASVLITDDIFEPQEDIRKSDRTAIYDGIINLSNEIILIIENKPDSNNVWEQQLNPSRKSLPSDLEIIPIAAIIKWKNIITNLNNLLRSDFLCKSEREIINDFLDFINKNFADLNPYDTLEDCKGSIDLLNRRIKNILESIAKNPDDVHYSASWGTNGCYYLDIESLYDEIWRIGIYIDNIENNNWNLIVEMYFADTIEQARYFYEKKFNYNKILELEGKGWEYLPHFHISHIQKHLVWLDTPPEKKQDYFEYWQTNISGIKENSQSELRIILKELKKKKLLDVAREDQKELKANIFDTDRKKLRVIPGIGLTYIFTSDRAKQLDKKDSNMLAEAIKKKIFEGMTIINQKPTFLK